MQPVPSPCIKVCVYEASQGHCRGCWRTLDEIARWGSMQDEERLRIIAACARREAAGKLE